MKFVFGIRPVDEIGTWDPSPLHAAPLPRDPAFDLSAAAATSTAPTQTHAGGASAAHAHLKKLQALLTEQLAEVVQELKEIEATSGWAKAAAHQRRHLLGLAG